MLFRLAAFVSYACNQSFFAPPEQIYCHGSNLLPPGWTFFLFAECRAARAAHRDKSRQLSFCLHSHFAIGARVSERRATLLDSRPAF
jgi:hypothetical protein